MSTLLLEGELTFSVGTVVAYQVSSFLLEGGLTFSVGMVVACQVSRFLCRKVRASLFAKVSVYVLARRPIADLILRDGRGYR